MTIVVAALWIFGLAFLAILWLAFAASLFEMFYGVVQGPDGTMRKASPWKRGLLAGAVGYGVIVLVYAGLNLMTGKSVFLTPALLGQSLLGSPVGGAIEAGPVLLYNGFHLAAFLALGVGAAWLLELAGRHPRIWYPGFVLLLLVFLHAVGMVLWLAAPASAAIPLWSIVAASAFAGAGMALVVLGASPEKVAALRHADLEV